MSTDTTITADPTDPQLIHVTFFKDEHAFTLETRDMALWDLRDLILSTSADAKTDLQLLKTAWFGNTPSAKKCLRHNDNVQALSGVIGEHDASTMSFDEALGRLRKAMITALIYTSPSHTEDRPRWRVIAPTSERWSSDEHARLIARLNGVLGGVLSGESFTLSQPYYYGKLNGNSAHRCIYTTGEFINLRDDLDEGAIYKKTNSKISNLTLTNVAGIDPDVLIGSLDDERLKTLPDPVRYIIQHAKPPDDASEKIRRLKGGPGHCYVVGELVRAGFNNAQIKAVYRLGNIGNGPRGHSRGFDGYVERVMAYCRARAKKETSKKEFTEIKLLAGLNVIDFEKVRKEKAKELNIRPHVLDRLVSKERQDEDDRKQGKTMSFTSPQPWKEAIDGEVLLCDICDAIQAYVVLPPHSCMVAALWILHTYLLDSFQVSPRLAINSPMRRCGKTTLLDVLGCLVFKPLSAANVSTAVVFRVVEAHRPTLLIDEGDSFLKKNEELRGVLNSGHRRGGTVLRNVGDEHEPRAFATYSAMAIALIGRLPETLHDRSVVVNLKRRTPDETVRSFRLDRAGHLHDLQRKAMRWTMDNKKKVTEIDPDIPEGIYNREADNWRPLLAIADVAGGRWVELSREALRQSHLEDDEDSRLGMLLGDIRSIFAEQGTDRMFSMDLMNQLIWIEGRPWADYSYGKPITQNQLARMLKPLGVAPQNIRISDVQLKGYYLHWFDEAFARYLDQVVILDDQSGDPPDDPPGEGDDPADE